MPWSFPSQLSELVDKEITKSLLRMETPSLLEASEGEFYEEEMQNGLHYQNYEDNYLLEAKKAAMLSRNGSIQDHNEFPVEFDATHECSDISGTPIPLPGQKRRRRMDMVVSSDSEDGPINMECSLVPIVDNSILSSHHIASPNFSSPLNGLIYHRTDNTVEDHPYPCSETAGGIDVNKMSMSVTTSYVPESIFFPETEIHETELFTKMASHGDAGASPEVSMDVLFENLLSVEANSFNSPSHTVQETTAVLENTSNVFNLSHQEGEGFSCNGHMENIIRGYPVMDECSRVDFNNKSKFVEKPEVKVPGDSVHELWKQLRFHHLDLLGHHVMPEKQETFQIVELVHRMSHLISDSDLLLSSCQPQVSTLNCEHHELVPTTLTMFLFRIYWRRQHLHLRNPTHSSGEVSNCRWHLQLFSMDFASLQMILLPRLLVWALIAGWILYQRCLPIQLIQQHWEN